MKGEKRELRGAASELGLSLDEAEVGQLLKFLDGLYLWNGSAGLTRIDRADAVRLHLVDSLLASGTLPTSGHVVDLGSGGGLPGIPLAIHHPSLRFTLVESNRRKANFLAEMRRDLELVNMEVLQVDVATLDKGVFDLVISRAFRGVEVFLKIAADLLVPGGAAVLMLAEVQVEELEAKSLKQGFSLESVLQRPLPLGEESRTVACLRKLPES